MRIDDSPTNIKGSLWTLARFAEQRRSDNVDPLRDFRLAIANNLSAEQTTGSQIAGHTHLERRCAWIIRLVIVSAARDSQRIEAFRARLAVTQTRANNSEVEDLQALRADRASVGSVAANGVLAGDPALLVCDRAERDIGRASKQSVVRLDAVPRREYVGQVRPHLARHNNRVADAKLSARMASERAVWHCARCNNHQVGAMCFVRGIAYRYPRRRSPLPLYMSCRDIREDAHTVAAQFFLNQKTDLCVDRWHYGFGPTEQRNIEAALRKGVCHLKPDVAAADENRGLARAFFKAPMHGEAV